MVDKNKFFITPSRFLGNSVILKQKVETVNVHDCFNPEEMAYVTLYGYAGLTKVFPSQLVEAKDYRAIDVIATHAYIPETGWCLVTKVDKVNILSFKLLLSIIFFLIFLGAAFLFSSASYLISKNITKSITRLKLRVDEIKGGNFDSKIKIDSNDEIGDFAKSLDVMVLTIKQAGAEVELKVKKQTKELQESRNKLQENIKEIEKVNGFMMNREEKMIELKRELANLKTGEIGRAHV